MPSLAIRARFPMGTFLGHAGAGQRSPLPDPMRLHAALTHAAGTGSLAVVEDGDLRPSLKSIEALRWLEEHPPSALELPTRMPADDRPAFSWRNEGVHETAKAPTERKALKAQSDAIALAGPVGWAWDVEVPVEILDTIAELCEDVACLGEGESVAILEVLQDNQALTVTHTGGGEVSPLQRRSRGDVRLEVPREGRFDELESAYRAANPTRRPTAASDRHKFGQLPRAELPPRESRATASYSPVDPPISAAPWATALRLVVDRPVPRTEAVRWAVAIHRSLCLMLGESATPMTTGAFPRGAVQPANRLAIQMLPDDGGGSAKFAVLIPSAAPVEEVEEVVAACGKLRRLYRRDAEVKVRGVEQFSAADYWPGVAPGVRRLWRPSFGLVADTRNTKNWTFQDSAYAAVGFLLRDQFSFEGQNRFRSLVDQVRRSGVRVGQVHAIADSKIERYAHKTPGRVVVRPYSAWFDLCSLMPGNALFALGQSRHLGGGLMHPIDVPSEVAQEMLDADEDE